MPSRRWQKIAYDPSTGLPLQQATLDYSPQMNLCGGIFDIAVDLCLRLTFDELAGTDSSRHQTVDDEADHLDVPIHTAFLANDESTRLTVERAHIASDFAIYAQISGK